MKYIIDFKPYIPDEINNNELYIIENKIKNKESITSEEAKLFLDTINYLTRYNINKNLDNYDNKCDLAQSILYHYLKNINCNPIPAMTQNVITNNIVGHSFIIVDLIINNSSTYFILDPTYIQFFKEEKCTKENYYVSDKYPDIVLLTPDPGYFIKDNMQNNALFLLNNGYLELNQDTSKMYGDSFLNTKTNVLFSTLKYQTIPGDVYINSFLKAHEPIKIKEEELIFNNINIETFENKKNMHNRK